MPPQDECVFLARGKRGIVYLDKARGTVLKKPHPASAARHALENEAHFLQEVNKVRIGPRFINFSAKGLEMEYVEGLTLPRFLQQADRQQTTAILRLILLQLRMLDKLGINKFELTRPTKHIIIRKDRPVLIDFERCRKTLKPKNITQFIQFLARRQTLALLQSKGMDPDPAHLLRMANTYKKSGLDKDFKTLLDYISAW